MATGQLLIHKVRSCNSPNIPTGTTEYTCKRNLLRIAKQTTLPEPAGGGEALHALALFFHFPGHLLVVIVGHGRVGKTDLGLNWHSHSWVLTCGKKRKIFHTPSSSCWKAIIQNCHFMAMYTTAVFRFFFSPCWSPITKQPSQCYAQQSHTQHPFRITKHRSNPLTWKVGFEANLLPEIKWHFPRAAALPDNFATPGIDRACFDTSPWVKSNINIILYASSLLEIYHPIQLPH